jgi:serine/threonine-protein kinase
MAGRRVGRYLMQDLIASGGMASVHIGRMTGPAGFTRVVAIKQLHEHLSADPDFVSMFLDEARLTGCVQHPNVVSTIDVVEDRGDLFLVMDYVLGGSLAQLMSGARRAGEPVLLPIASSIMGGALGGLHAAHEVCTDGGQPLDIVHRDVSPQNILVGADGVARVADFGIAKAAARMHSTREGKIKGKLAYMAPEQLKGGAVDRRTDIYSAGVVLWELITSKRLFPGGDPAAVVGAVVRGPPCPPSAHRPEVPRALDDVVSRAMATDPTSRYATALEFLVDLERAVPPAPAHRVAAWVNSIVGPKLAELRKLAQEMPTSSHAATIAVALPAPFVPTPPALAEPLPAAEPVQVSIAGETGSARAGATSRAWIALGGALLAGGVAWAALRGQTHRPAIPDEGTAAGAVAPTASAVPPESQRPAVLTMPVSTLSASAPAAPSAPPAASARPSHGNGHAAYVPPAASPAPATPSAATSASCNPPFSIDLNGVKRFKPSCF